jgi:hypothetical protein
VLAPVEDALTAALVELAAEGHEARLELLEAVACRLAQLSLTSYRRFNGVTRTLKVSVLERKAVDVAEALEAVPIASPLALTALAREPQSRTDQRRAGSYYTDFRLAMFLAERAVRAHPLAAGDPVIDAASGTGILLVALGLAAFGDDADALDEFVRRSACAADLSAVALRGTRLALASLAKNIESVRELDKRLRPGDSLVAGVDAWRDVAPNGFAIVIGNPPWEKLKISRHEHLGALGALRHYGDDYGVHQELVGLDRVRGELADYVKSLEYELQGKGEPDLYKLFLALSSALVSHRGEIAMLVPAGLIRSEGTQVLREYLFSASPEMSIAILDNKARFFSIDTRFKFLAVTALIDPSGERSSVVLEHARGDEHEVHVTGTATLSRDDLVVIRPDHSLPEVRSNAEWELFRRLSDEGVRLDDPAGPWRLHFSREVDMTNDRALFARAAHNGSIPLIEGRMVHQFRHSAKAYRSGTGRRADWDWQSPGEYELRPQFWIDPDDLPKEVHERAARPRIGFCDITGQTNERSMLASSIPAGVVCGNKVPTIVFRDPPYDESLLAGVWLAVANSFAFDWLLRRVITTTVNYFLLLSVPFPRLDLDGATARRLAELAHEVEGLYAGVTKPDDLPLGAHRAEMDALVINAYGLSINEARVVLNDFPLLDRGQPSLPGERRSTITRDLVLLKVLELTGLQDQAGLGERVDAAMRLGAEPYIPSQLAQQRMTITA